MRKVDCIAVLKALSDLTRMRIMRLLLQRSYSVGDVAKRLGLSHYNASKHLRILRDAGLIETEQRGKRHFNTVASALKSRLASNKNVLELRCCTFRFDNLPR